MGIKRRDLENLLKSTYKDTPKLSVIEAIRCFINDEFKSGELAAYFKENYTIRELQGATNEVVEFIKQRSKGFMAIYDRGE